MATLKVEAERLRAGLGGGWLTTATAIAWADDLIAAQARPEIALIDVAAASGRDRSEVAQLLSSVPGEAEPIAVMRRCLADIRVWIKGDVGRARQAASYLYKAACSDALPDEEFGFEPLRFEDAFEVAEKGVFGSVEETMADLDSFLERHGRVV